jgi:hypothetical protein
MRLIIVIYYFGHAALDNVKYESGWHSVARNHLSM